jgi:rubrerythrin
MAIKFSADEILEMAERMERNGARFYRRAAECNAAASAREMLLALAAMEDDHEAAFGDMRDQLSNEERQPTAFDPDDEEGMYLSAMTDVHVFDTKTDACDLLTGSESLEQILHTAIGMEKDSVVFYLGLKPLVPARLGLAWVEHIIAEEMRHLSDLSKQLAAIK